MLVASRRLQLACLPSCWQTAAWCLTDAGMPWSTAGLANSRIRHPPAGRSAAALQQPPRPLRPCGRSICGSAAAGEGRKVELVGVGHQLGGMGRGAGRPGRHACSWALPWLTLSDTPVLAHLVEPALGSFQGRTTHLAADTAGRPASGAQARGAPSGGWCRRRLLDCSRAGACTVLRRAILARHGARAHRRGCGGTGKRGEKWRARTQCCGDNEWG